MQCACDKHFDRKKLDETIFSSAIPMAETKYRNSASGCHINCVVNLANDYQKN